MLDSKDPAPPAPETPDPSPLVLVMWRLLEMLLESSLTGLVTLETLGAGEVMLPR